MINRLKILLLIGLFFVTFCVNTVFAEEILKLATTTSTYETGLLDYVFPAFEKKYNVKIHIISVGTGKAIKLGENGDVDVLLVHSPEVEEGFIREGYGLNRKTIMSNNFIIIGPKDDPACVRDLKNVKNALKNIARTQSIFVSRGDDSGTHNKEKFLWSKAGIVPQGEWYLESGQGMTQTLVIADEKNAYCLTDRATYLFNRDRLRLVKLLEEDNDLENPYSVIAVNPHKHSHIKYKLSMKFIEWITSSYCLRKIENYKKNGTTLFVPFRTVLNIKIL